MSKAPLTERQQRISNVIYPIVLVLLVIGLIVASLAGVWLVVWVARSAWYS